MDFARDASQQFLFSLAMARSALFDPHLVVTKGKPLEYLESMGLEVGFDRECRRSKITRIGFGKIEVKLWGQTTIS